MSLAETLQECRKFALACGITESSYDKLISRIPRFPEEHITLLNEWLIEFKVAYKEAFRLYNEHPQKYWDYLNSTFGSEDMPEQVKLKNRQFRVRTVWFQRPIYKKPKKVNNDLLNGSE